LKKISSRTLSVALTAMILLPFIVALMPTVSNQPLVKGASPATLSSNITEGYVGDYVTVTGTGFTANRDVTFAWGNQLLSSLGFVSSLPYYQRPSIYRSSTGEVHSDAFGNFKIQLQVPKLRAGNYTVKAFDAEISATTNFEINARVLLRNRYAYQKHGSMQTPMEQPSRDQYIGLFLAEGFVGDRLAIQLSGFDNGEPVEVKINTTTVGTFNVGFGSSQGYYFSSSAATLPEMLGGQFAVTATGRLSGVLATSTFKVKPELFLARQTTPPPYNLGYPWLYSDYFVGGHFALGWYSSVNSAASSTFMLEATGLTGTAVQSVNVTYAGSTVVCTLSGTLTVSSRGSTQGVGGGTAPFTANTPFTVNSPTAQTASAITSGTILNVMVKTSGTGAATFTFQKQLVASQANLTETTGNTVWLEGTVSSPGLHLSDKVGGINELISTNLKALTSYRTSAVHSSGTTVEKTDVDGIASDTLTLFDQGSQPLSYVDTNSNAVWNVGENVYQDIDNSGTVTAGDRRINTVNFGGSTYWPWSTVVGTDADLGRNLVDFDAIQRPAHDTIWYDTVYLDLNRDGVVSEGDTRISYDRESISAASFTSDNNGFLAAWFTVPTIPGGGKVYNFNLWNFVADGGVATGNSVTLEILASLTVSSPTYQTLKYVAEGYTGVTLSGNGFFGAEQLTISIGGKYVTTSVTPTPNVFGTLSAITISSIPALAGGSQSIVAQGLFTEENTASASVFVTPALSVTPTSGYNLNPVTSVAVTGKGFEAGAYEVVLDGFGNSSSVASFTVVSVGDEAGQVNVAFNLPSGIEGAHTIDVVKTNSTTPLFFGESFFSTNGLARTGVSTTYPYPTDSEFPAVTIYPSLQVSPTATVVGGLVSVTGKGLQPTTSYYVWFSQRGTSASDAILVSTEPTELASDDEGTLTATFNAPESSGGTRAVWVSTSNSLVNNDPVTGAPVVAQMTIRPALVLEDMSGEVGANVDVSFSGLTTGNEYQLWWYNPEEANVGDILFGTSLVKIPQTAIPLAFATGAAYGNSTLEVTFTIPSTAENGKIYAVDLTNYGNRYSVLSQPVFFTVGKVASMITLNLTPSTVTEGESVAINGVIQPAMAVQITIHITPPNGTSTAKTVTSSSSGTFTDTFTPNSAGTWQVTAQWDGDATYAAYQSLAATVTVKPVDISWTYAVAGIAIGSIALIVGLLVTVWYFLYKRKPRAPAASTPTAPTPPK
jgi:hypothetical protein